MPLIASLNHQDGSALMLGLPCGPKPNTKPTSAGDVREAKAVRKAFKHIDASEFAYYLAFFINEVICQTPELAMTLAQYMPLAFVEKARQ